MDVAEGGGGMPPGWLPPGALNEMAGALWSMADGNADNQREIASAGGILPLIKMLTHTATLHRYAAGALWALAAEADNQQLIASHGGIPPLVALLSARQSSRSSRNAQDTAAGALANLARTAAIRSQIAAAGGIQPLVSLFDMGRSDAKAQSAIALKTMVLENDANQYAVATGLVRVLSMGSAEAQEQVTELVRDLCLDLESPATVSFNENRSAVARAGGIPQLVKQLKGGTDRAQTFGAEALSLIALRSSDLRVQVTQQLVGLLGAESEEVRQRAGFALREMAAEGGDESQKASAMAGGVGPLVALLKDGLRDERLEAQEYAL
jgi:hypothetical protein